MTSNQNQRISYNRINLANQKILKNRAYIPLTFSQSVDISCISGNTLYNNTKEAWVIYQNVKGLNLNPGFIFHDAVRPRIKERKKEEYKKREKGRKGRKVNKKNSERSRIICHGMKEMVWWRKLPVGEVRWNTLTVWFMTNVPSYRFANSGNRGEERRETEDKRKRVSVMNRWTFSRLVLNQCLLLISSIHVNIVDWTDRFSFEKKIDYVRSVMFREFFLGIFNKWG